MQVKYFNLYTTSLTPLKFSFNVVKIPLLHLSHILYIVKESNKSNSPCSIEFLIF